MHGLLSVQEILFTVVSEEALKILIATEKF